MTLATANLVYRASLCDAFAAAVLYDFRSEVEADKGAVARACAQSASLEDYGYGFRVARARAIERYVGARAAAFYFVVEVVDVARDD